MSVFIRTTIILSFSVSLLSFDFASSEKNDEPEVATPASFSVLNSLFVNPFTNAHDGSNRLVNYVTEKVREDPIHPKAEEEFTTYTVTNTNDSGAGSFRQALIDASNNAGADMIEFDASLSGATITITSEAFPHLASIYINSGGDITIDGDINGDGTADVTISGGNSAAGIAFESINVTIRNLILTNFETGNNAGSGVIFAITMPSLTLENVMITNYNSTNPNGSSAMRIQNSNVTLNRVIITGTNLTSNTASEPVGTAMHITSTTGNTIAISNSLFYNNNYTYSGTNTEPAGATIYFVQTSSTGNSTMTVSNVVISDNKIDLTGTPQPTIGAGLVVVSTGNTINVTVSNSILANNTALGTYFPGFSSSGVNLAGVSLGGTVNLTQNTNIVGTFTNFTDAANGDYTIPQSATTAIDAGTNANASGSSDLAGNTRISNTTVDIGAYELQVASAPTSVTVAATVFLEGAYNGTNLNTTLNANIPSAQPYSGSTYNNHGGSENASAPANAVDWILVEVREAGSAAAALNATKVGSAAGFLMNDGTIKATDGTSNLSISLSGNSGATFFVVVYHRNHLPIMSSSAISESSGTYTIDFTSNSANTHQTTTALASLTGGKFGMPSGDADGDGDVDASDLASWRNQNGGAFTYNSTNADFNLDGVINAVDRNLFWKSNNASSKTRQVPST